MKETRDLWFAAFLLMKGSEVLDYKVIDGKGTFSFDLSAEEWKSRKLEFNKSDFSTIKWNIEKLKDLIF